MSPPPPKTGPLAGFTVAVVCSALKVDAFREPLERLGALVVPLPLIELRECSETAEIDRALDSLDSYDWAIFTSAHGVLYFMRRAAARQLPAVPWRRPAICAVGPATAAELGRYGMRAELVPEVFTAEGALDSLLSRLGGRDALAGLRFLIPAGTETRDFLPRRLRACGAFVHVVTCYENALAFADPSVIRNVLESPPRVFVFTSPSTVRNFLATMGAEDGTRLLGRAVLAALGPSTAAALKEIGRAPEILPAENTAAGLVDAIRLHFGT